MYIYLYTYLYRVVHSAAWDHSREVEEGLAGHKGPVAGSWPRRPPAADPEL